MTRQQTLEDLGSALQIVEETILLHTASFTGNSCEARIIVTIAMPDGRVMGVNRVIRLAFKSVTP